jgi:predicted protein tyrosine phosphatase
MKVLFVCSMARLRSKTASDCLGYDSEYAGLDSDADVRLSQTMLDHADTVVCMEASHKTKLRKKFNVNMSKVQVWGIPDDYEYMDDTLLCLLRGKAETLLGFTTENKNAQ